MVIIIMETPFEDIMPDTLPQNKGAYRFIYKYQLDIVDLQRIEVSGKNVKPLSVGEQNGILCLWVAVEPDFDSEPQELLVNIIGTGNKVAAIAGQFIGTVQMQNGLVWHIFVDRYADI